MATKFQESNTQSAARPPRQHGGKAQTPARNPGRPAGVESDQVRQKLLTAARKLFLSYEFKAVSIRQIAAMAGVNGAMVNYYFGGKRGLYLAMVDELVGALDEPLRDLHRQSEKSVPAFIAAYMKLLAANPWWPNFVIREVLFGEEEFRRSIIQKFSTTFASGLISAVNHEVSAGHYRQDLKAPLATWSLVSMMVFPFLSRPIASGLLGKELDEETVGELIRHTTDLFERGVSRPERTS